MKEIIMITREEYEYFNERIETHEDVDILSRGQSKVSYDVLLSLYYRKVQDVTRKTYHIHKKPSRVQKYYERYLNGEELVAIAEEINLSPCLLAKNILSHHYQIYYKSLSKKQVGKLMKNIYDIEDEHLRDEVSKCIQYDDVYSPLADQSRQHIGREYEYVLYEKLRNNGIGCTSEKELRKKAYIKTPDALLSAPIMLNGQLVYWIESKATFCDDYILRKTLRDQLHGYTARYGPGVVIYWFGFIEDLQETLRDKSITMMNSFPLPQDIIKL